MVHIANSALKSTFLWNTAEFPNLCAVRPRVPQHTHSLSFPACWTNIVGNFVQLCKISCDLGLASQEEEAALYLSVYSVWTSEILWSWKQIDYWNTLYSELSSTENEHYFYQRRDSDIYLCLLQHNYFPHVLNRTSSLWSTFFNTAIITCDGGYAHCSHRFLFLFSSCV